ncbi:FGF1 (predicted) [Pycnogonum litorale]
MASGGGNGTSDGGNKTTTDVHRQTGCSKFSFLLCNISKCCGSKKKRKRTPTPELSRQPDNTPPTRIEDNEQEPYVPPPDPHDMSESPVPEIPVATPEASDDETKRSEDGGVEDKKRKDGGDKPKDRESGKNRPEVETKTGEVDDGTRPEVVDESIVTPSIPDIDDQMFDSADSDSNDEAEPESSIETNRNRRDPPEANGPNNRVHDAKNVAGKNSTLDGAIDLLPSVPGVSNPGRPRYWSSVKQLYSRTGYHLAICPNGNIRGINDDNHPYAVLEFRSPSAYGEVQIKGKKTGLYLTMNAKSRLYGQADSCHEGTFFNETLHDGYNRYLSKLYQERQWFVGIKKSGKAKPGWKTDWKQKSVQFLPRASPS